MDENGDESSNISNVAFERSVQRINKQPKDNFSKSKYVLQFYQETKEELMERKEEARKALKPIPLEQQEVSDNYFPPEIDMPKRPPWDFTMSKEQLDIREQRYFAKYLKNFENFKGLNYFELNLETWRQLWRVLEMSDVLLIIVDIRYSVLMFPPYLYYYITHELQKDMILILNKIDLVPSALVVAWKDYFCVKYPKVHILMFTSYPTYNLHGNMGELEELKLRRRKGKLKMAAEGAQKLLQACKNIVGDNVDLNSWHEKIQNEMSSEYDMDEIERKDNIKMEKEDTTFFKHEKYKNGILTIGCIGTPNVGKSSLINALMGKKVVSVSRTPGHTKHFQTIFLTKTVCLCDCPGLVFPSTVPKQFQILMGSFPIAQVKEPYTTVKFLAERIDLINLLKIQHQDNDDTWSAIDICNGWAAKKNFMTARTARLDTYRAANSLLRMALEGKICIYVYPPQWSIYIEKWQQHPDVETVKWIQGGNKNDKENLQGLYSTSEDEEEIMEAGAITVSKEESSTSDCSSEDSDLSTFSNKFNALSTET
ncbi:guanine nucleotide-binding protein-like 1 isoform X2 [Prorops nasuta]